MSQSTIERMLADMQWAPIEIVSAEGPAADMPFATHSGELVIGEIRIKCWRLNTGQAVIDPESLDKLFPGWRDVMAAVNEPVPEPTTFHP